MTDTSGVFSLPSADERRAFRDRLGRGIAYFIPPELRQLGTFLADATPSAALERAGSASMRMVAPGRTPSERVGDFGNMLSETAGVAAPAFAGRAIPSAEAAQEVFMGISAPVRSATETFIERMNQPGPMPERLMSGVDPLAAFRAAREAVLGASNETPFEDLVELSSRQSAARDAAVEALSGARNVRLFDPQGRGVVVGEGMGPGEEGRFRVTYFNAERRPSNHTVYETREEALNAALREGFTFPTADRGSSEFDPEAIIRALREGVPQAEARTGRLMDIGNQRIREAAGLSSPDRGPRITIDDLFNVMGEEGAGSEYPGIGAALDRYVSRSQTPDKLAENFNVAINDPDYPLYREALQTNLRQTFGDRPIPVTRTEGYADPNAEKVRESFNISQDDVFFVGNPDERELIARLPDGRVRSVRIAARGPENFAEGGAVMMRSNMSKELQGGIGGFADRAKNMFNEGGEVGRGQGQGSTTGRPVSGSAAGANLGADDDFLTSVRNRVMRQSGVDPLRIAMDEGVDPDLFLRLIAQESGGRADAQSDAGAYGFTQLMDATARELGVDRTDPVQNLRGGARYLRQQLDRFQEVPLALAAYNAGPTAVERFGGIPPYSETRAYVARILGLPGGEMGVSPPMRPDPIVPTPRPPMQGPMLEGDPLGELGNVLATTPLQMPAQAPAMPEQEQPMVGQPPQTQFTRDQGMPGERLFMDLMRNMP